MNFPIVLERDAPVIENTTAIPGWSASFVDLSGADALRMRNNGLTYTDFGAAYCIADTPAISAGQVAGIGLHMQGPQESDEGEYTPYAISAHCICQDTSVRPFVFYGENGGTLSDGSSGNLMQNCKILAGGDGTKVEFDGTVLLKEITADRAIGFGIGLLADASGASDADAAVARISVRRLISLEPRVIDVGKLG